MPHPPLARRHVGRFIAWAVLLATIGAAAGKAQQVARVRATIEAVNGNNLSLTTRTGDKLTVSLAPNVAVVAIVPVRLEDIIVIAPYTAEVFKLQARVIHELG